MKQLSGLLLLLFIYVSHQSILANDINLNSKHVSMKDGLAGNTVNELMQDSVGYIWLATNNGLSRYDGYSTVNYASLSPKGSSNIEARIGRIFYDSAGLLWISTGTYVNGCYDLTEGRFVDWTGKGDLLRPLNKVFLSRHRGMFFYGYSFGVRRATYENGTFHTIDYHQSQGHLPSNEVSAIIEDDADNIWISTTQGIVRLSVGEQLQTLLGGQHIIAITSVEGNIYALTAEGKAYCFNTKGQPTGTYTFPSSLGSIEKVNTHFVWQGRWMLFTPGNTFSMDLKSGTWRMESGLLNVADGLNQGACAGYHFISNRSGRLWIFPEKGEARMFDLLQNAHLSVNRGRKFHITDDGEGRLFIATYGNGLFVWNTKTDALSHFTAEQANPVVQNNYLLCIMRDRQGSIWLGSEGTGAYCLSVMTNNGNSSAMNYLLPEPDRQGDWANTVSCVTELDDTNIIIGTREGNLYDYDRKSRDMKKIAERQATVTAFFVDRDGHEWVGTNGKGLFINGQQYCKEDKSHYLPENKVLDISQDRRGRIWIASRDGGLLMASPSKDGQPVHFEQFLNREMNESRVKDLELDSHDRLWIATNNGIYLFDTRSAACTNESFTPYNTANGRFPYDELFSIHYAKGDSCLWVGAPNSGAVKCRLEPDGRLTLTRITTREGLASNNIYSFAEDRFGYLWASTENGLSRINMRNNIVNSYHPSPFLLGNVFTENSVCQAADGLICFGTNYGLVTIAPQADNQRQARLPARITDLRAGGESLLPLAATPTLPHDQNSLSFRFSDFNYDNTQSSLYQYYLEGLEHTWQPMTSINHADYAQLPPGDYVFHLRSLGAGNEWLPETSISITIRRPWYWSWWAWIAYLLIAFLACWYVWSNWKEKFDLHQQMKLQRQLMDFRAQLFTNITHEFRTPLAIIKRAVEKLDTDSSDRQALQTARRGTSRMLRLVNQFMEYRKVTTGNLHLGVSRGDIVAFVKEIYLDFRPMTQQKELNITFTPSVKSFVMLFDRQMIETIIYNLLSNAVKYTPQGGSISVKVKTGETSPASVSISVEDSGPGISEERQEAMFQPFMQGLASQGGMGIGLFTAHEMAITHHGQLSYTRLPNGSLFTLEIPCDDGAYDNDEQVSLPQSDANDHETEDFVKQMSPQALNDLTIAIIEDDPDMLEQLRTELGIFFRIAAYANGQAGFEAVSQQPPALLICDVMLPDLNGYDIVAHLRQQPSTTTLPIIMLTALADERHQLQAYKAGADDYMVKPCNFRLLVARAMQLLKWRGLKQDEATADPETSVHIKTEPPSPASPLIISQADKVFFDKLAMLTAQHLSEATFSVDRLADLMSMGRTKFYGKVKEMTGLSPNKYLMQERMKKAADLLADGELNISEVSYRVGIQDPSYFNKCFKAHFGVVPSKYVKPA